MDAENLFVTGGSGGGALTAWIVGTTDRFRAACSVKPCINWMSWALTVDLQDTPELRNWFPTAPWLDPDLLWRLSPLSRAHKVQTPTMVICGELDLRTPIAESEQFFTVLQKCGTPSALVRLPGTNHLGGRPSHWLAHALYALDWFERYRTDGRPG